MNLPENLQYTKEHEWVRIEGNTAVIGITAYAQDQLGDIVYVDIPTVGQEVAANEIFGTVEAVKTVSDLFMPITGTVTAFNEVLNTNPDFVNADPYGKGWMIKVNISGDHSQLLSQAEYAKLIGA